MLFAVKYTWKNKETACTMKREREGGNDEKERMSCIGSIEKMCLRCHNILKYYLVLFIIWACIYWKGITTLTIRTRFVKEEILLILIYFKIILGNTKQEFRYRNRVWIWNQYELSNTTFISINLNDYFRNIFQRAYHEYNPFVSPAVCCWIVGMSVSIKRNYSLCYAYVCRHES